jgi:hypothetical protein
MDEMRWLEDETDAHWEEDVGWIFKTEADESATMSSGDEDGRGLVHLNEGLYQGTDAEVWRDVGRFLEDREYPEGSTLKEQERIRRKAKNFLVMDGVLYRKATEDEMPKEVIAQKDRRQRLLKATHDQLGHKGTFATYTKLQEKFYWTRMASDTEDYVKSCDVCQRRDRKRHEEIAHPTYPACLNAKVAVDLVAMPPAQGFHYIILARCDLSGYVEGRAIKKKTAATVAKFIFEEIICKGSMPGQLTCDLGTEFMGEVNDLLGKYRIPKISTTAYHPEANGMLERGNRPIKEAIIRSCRGNLNHWPDRVPLALLADRVTTKRTTKSTPYFLRFGEHPVLPFDYDEATWLVRGWERVRTTADLLAMRMRQLEKRDEDVEMALERIKIARKRSVDDRNEAFSHVLQDKINRPLRPGDLVLVKNSALEVQHGRKMEDRWLGPFRMVQRTSQGAYVLEELDGTRLKLSIAGNRVKRYYQREDVDVDLLAEQGAEELNREAHLEDESDEDDLALRDDGRMEDEDEGVGGDGEEEERDESDDEMGRWVDINSASQLSPAPAVGGNKSVGGNKPNIIPPHQR